MKLEKLKELYKDFRHNPNYQHKDLSHDIFLKNATESFKKLPDAQKELVLLTWAGKLGKTLATITADEINELLLLRYLSQTNLFFLCHLLESYSQTTIQAHEEICNKFFVRKDPNFLTFESFANRYADLKDRMLLVSRGGFKALALDTKIPTPSGMSTIAELKVGDLVFGDDGKICNVVGKSDVFVGRECYEIVFSTGEKIVADGDHLWITDARKDRDRNKDRAGCPSIKTTKEIFDTIYCRKENNHRVAISKPIEIPEKEYSIPPYVLGCWLGDGTSSNSNITNSDEQIIEEIRKEGVPIRKASYSGPYLYVTNGGKKDLSYRKRIISGENSSLHSKLRELNFLNNKHIPNDYLRGSYSQRLSLLQGLMDTGGACDKRGHCSFSNKNKLLIEQVRELVASLGLKPYKICEFDSYCGDKYCGKAYQLGFIAYKGMNVFRLERKLSRLQERKKVSLSENRQIVEVNRVESVPTQCISVDSYNHTYLVGSSFIVTHNSSLNMADCIQWVICFPEITILILTGILSLAVDFVGEIKAHFDLAETGEKDNKGNAKFQIRKLRDRYTGEESDSFFQVIFAEHCTSPREGKQVEFQTPASFGNDKEPTIRAASIEQSLSGGHFCILKLDDVITNENSKTLQRMNEVKRQISINKGMLHPYGFFDVIGTWYDERDYYGTTIKREEIFAEKEGLLHSIQGSIDSGRFNSNVKFIIYLRAAWWPTEAAIASGKIEEEMKKEDWVLWFPERLTYEFLKHEQENDSDVDEDGDTGYFAIKYLNNPRKINRVKFPRELLLRRTIPHTQLPPQGIVVMAVDTAYSIKAWADYTVIITALIHGGRFYIINMCRGKFNEYELPKVIAGAGNRWKPKRIVIEDSMGVRWMGRELRREMDKLSISIPVEFCPLGAGNKSRSKLMKSKPVARLLGDERLYFLNSCEGLDEIYSELEKFTGTTEDSHDDIVSGLSILVEQFGSYADMDARINIIDSDYVANKKSRIMHDVVYGLGNYSRFNTTNDNPVTAYQIDANNSSFNSSNAVNDAYVDPLADLSI